MRILFLSEVLPHARVVSGAVNVNRRICLLAARGHEVGLAAFIRPSEVEFIPELRPALYEMELLPAPPERQWLRRAIFFGLRGVPGPFAEMRDQAMQQLVGRMIDRNTLKRVFLPVSMVLAPAMLALSFAQGWLVLPLAGAVAASIFGQVTVNETMAARYISPALRARIYSVRFFVGFLGAAAAAPVVSVLYERTGSVAAVTMLLSGFSVVTLGCALFFPNREEELKPELWAQAMVPAAAE